MEAVYCASCVLFLFLCVQRNLNQLLKLTNQKQITATDIRVRHCVWDTRKGPPVDRNMTEHEYTIKKVRTMSQPSLR